MKDILEEIEMMANCKTCTWNQFCVKPPIMTRNEMESTLRAMEKDARSSEEAGFGMLMGMMTLLGKDTDCPTCPIFVRRMRETPTLTQKIRELMQGQEACKDCGWEKFCLYPPVMTEEEKKAKIEKLEKQDDPEKAIFRTLMGTIIYGGKDTDCLACPVFVKKLRESPSLAQELKKIMQNWES